MNIGVVGTGYVGLTQAVAMASYLKNHNFIGYDIDKSKIEKLSNGIPTIYEKGLEELLKSDLENGNLSFTNNIDDLHECNFIFIAVGTPTIAGQQDLRFLKNVVNDLNNLFKSYPDHEVCLVVKSTVLPGTCEMVAKMVKDNPNIIVADNPEFLKEGTSLDDFLNPDKVVLGIDHNHDLAPSYIKSLKQLYTPICNPENIITSTLAVSQACKYVNNDMLATKISKVNEYRTLFSEMSDYEFNTLMHSLGSDSRISDKFLNSGPGFGGSCFKKDVLALVDYARSKGDIKRLPLLGSTVPSNELRIEECYCRINNIIKSHNITEVMFLGAAFKSGTDDVRYSTAIDIIRNVVTRNPNVIFTVHDPEASENAKLELSDCEINKFSGTKDVTDLVKELPSNSDNSTAVVVLTEWGIYDYMFKTYPDFITSQVGVVIDSRHAASNLENVISI